MNVVDFFFPNRCLQCNTIINGEEIVCELCYPQIHFAHFQNSKENNVHERCKALFPIENAYALMQFEEENLSRKIIHELKYNQREKLGKILANWTIDQIQLKEKPDLLVSIPLHPTKQKKRGYNQLHLFTETLSNAWEIPLDHEILKRNLHTSEQAKKNKQERQIANPKFSLQKEITNQHILMIDDVLTTGNTMSEAVWEILKSGNNKVSILVMAID